MGGPEERKKQARCTDKLEDGKPKLPEPKTDQLRKHKKVLFVDDEDLMLNLHKAMIGRIDKNIDVFTALSGKEALEILSREGDIELVVTDYNLKAESGVDLLCRLIEDYPMIKTLLFTSCVAGAEQEAMQKGLVGIEIIFKNPETLNDLYQRIQDILYK